MKLTFATIAAFAAVAGALAGCQPPDAMAAMPADDGKTHSPVPANRKTMNLNHTKWKAPAGAKTEVAMYAAGCFWGVEAAFRKMDGVVATAVGYSGGTLKNPTYEDVCSHTTGHAEVVAVEFDPATISFEKLTEKYFSFHNPTTLNRQGPDIGDNYRSAIYYFTPEQQKTAEAVKDKIGKSGKWSNPIVTQIAPAKEFWRAEEYHQQYAEKNPYYHCPIGG